MELEVKGCSDCPMCQENDMSIGYSCNATGGNLVSKNFEPITPDWCPLKTEPIIITLKEN